MKSYPTREDCRQKLHTLYNSLNNQKENGTVYKSHLLQFARKHCLMHFDITSVLERHGITPNGILLDPIPIETMVELENDNRSKRMFASEDKKDIQMHMGLWEYLRLIVDMIM